MVLGKRGLRSSSRRVPSQRVSRSAVRSTRSGKRSPLDPPVPKRVTRKPSGKVNSSLEEGTSHSHSRSPQRKGRKKVLSSSTSDESSSEEEEDAEQPLSQRRRLSKPNKAKKGKTISSGSSSEDEQETRTKKKQSQKKARPKEALKKPRRGRPPSCKKDESSSQEEEMKKPLFRKRGKVAKVACDSSPDSKKRRLSTSETEEDTPPKRGTRSSPAKRPRKRLSKVKLAQMKLKQMHNLGAWGTPPRRAASLNAAAKVTCLYDWDAHRNTTSGGNSSNNSSPSGGSSKKKVVKSESDKSVSESPKAAKSVSKGKSPAPKSKPGRKKKVLPPPEVSVAPSSSESSCSEEPERKSPSKKKKSLKDEFKMDIKDMIVKKRIASLNASAIMTASYGNYDANKPPKEEPKVKEPEEPPKKIASFKKESNSLLPPKKNKSKVASDTIIVEIQDEDIKNQLIASAMKKAGKHHHLGKTHSCLTPAALPPKKRALHDSLNAKFKKKQRASEKIVYEDEEEIETITTEGAARSAAEEEASSSSSTSIQPPIALNTEMNKMDLVIDGRVVHGGMYQVVHRFETISTTTALMNRDQQNNRESQDGSRKFAALSLQTAASNNPPGERLSSGPFLGSAPTAHSLAGYYQPPAPLLRASSPISQSTTAVSSAPPTATVQPTVLSTTGKRAPSPEKESSRSSPLKPTPTALPHPYYPYAAGHFAPYPPPPHHQYFDPALHPAAYHHHHPYNPHPPPPPTYRHHPAAAYPIAPGGPYYPFQPGGYYLAAPNPFPNAGHPPPSGHAPPPPMAAPAPPPPSTTLLEQHSNRPSLSSSSTAPPAAATHQVTLQGTSSSFNYATLGQSPYPTAGRIIAPIFALAPPNLMEHHHPVQPAPPNPLYPYAFPNLSSSQGHIPSSQGGGGSSLAEASKNELAGSLKVGKGPDSQNNTLPTQAAAKKKEKKAPKAQQPTSSSSSTHTSINTTPTTTTTPSSSSNSGSPKTTVVAPPPPPPVAASAAATGAHLLARSANGGGGPVAALPGKAPPKDPRKPSKKKEESSKITLPKGLVITEIESPPVLHIPEPAPRQQQQQPKRGHPGLPNGLLRMATTSVQNNHRSSNGGQPPGSNPSSSPITRVTPKDLKSKIALCRIGLINQSAEEGKRGDEEEERRREVVFKAAGNNNRIYLKPPTRLTPNEAGASFKKLKRKKDYDEEQCSQISVSMAQCAVSAVLKSQGAPPKLIHKSCPKSPYYPAKGRPLSTTNGSNSPSSSRSSSRNSSLSPRERTPHTPKAVLPPSKTKHHHNALLNFNTLVSSKKKASLPPPMTTTTSPHPAAPPKKHRGPPRLSNGWSWVGECTEQKVYLNNEDPPTLRNCYASMKHTEGDVVKVRDCILLASGNRKKDLPFIAKVTSLWEHPDNGEMMLSLLWYYRPEHLDNGRHNYELSDEIYASKHRDFTSVACVEDKCYVMTHNEYCRYRKFLRMIEQNVTPPVSVIPELESGYYRQNFLPKCRVAPDRVFLCRRVYESRQRRLLKNPV